MKFITFPNFSYKLDKIHYTFRTNCTKTYCKPNLNDHQRPTTMFGHEPEKAGHCLCLLLIRLDNLLLRPEHKVMKISASTSPSSG